MSILESTSHSGDDELDALMGVQWLQFSILQSVSELASLNPDHWLVQAVEEAAAVQAQSEKNYNPDQRRLVE